MTVSQYKIIDLFAGPGGLGEGFSTVKNKNGEALFKIVISVEKDPIAHKTLLLRAFLRKFNTIPEEYYQYIQGNISINDLYEKYPEQKYSADNEALNHELGKKGDNKLIYQKIKNSLDKTENWILIGGPPCQAYSIIGRSRRKNDDPEKLEKDKRQFLYREYLRIIYEFEPPFFLMENVKGILSSTIKGEKIFQKIISDLKNPAKAFRKTEKNKAKYKIYSLIKIPKTEKNIKPMDYVIKSENYGVPQSRHRVFLFGVREDINIKQLILDQKKTIPLNDVITGLPKLRSGLSKKKDSLEKWKKEIGSIKETKWLDKIDDKVKTLMLNIIDDIKRVEYGRGSDFVDSNINYKNDEYLRWFMDERLLGFCNHSTRSHIRKDLYRYLFASCYAKTYAHSPKISDFPRYLLPEHRNVKNGDTDDFSDRFRVQIENKPSTTITSHIAKDGHYYIHPDPRQCRSFTVREAARLQTFPDNYFFEGPRTEQYKQVGNAVPPLLAKDIALLVSQMIQTIQQ